jgi:hypothetical protein
MSLDVIEKVWLSLVKAWPKYQKTSISIDHERFQSFCHQTLRTSERSEGLKKELIAPTRRGTRLFENPRSLLTVERAFQLPEPLKDADPPAIFSRVERESRPSKWEKVKNFFWDLGATLKETFERRPWEPKRY